ncbi:hypothetical protein HED49_13585 [Ochrobactrum daejeonense]|nr:hypothetical protein [Brucella daejeonensis]
MLPCSHTPLTRTLVLLLALALGSAAIAGFSGGLPVAVAVILVFAFAKGWFVILDFMEMRGTRGPLPALLVWLAILLSLAFARSVVAHIFL